MYNRTIVYLVLWQNALCWAPFPNIHGKGPLWVEHSPRIWKLRCLNPSHDRPKALKQVYNLQFNYQTLSKKSKDMTLETHKDFE